MSIFVKFERKKTRKILCNQFQQVEIYVVYTNNKSLFLWYIWTGLLKVGFSRKIGASLQYFRWSRKIHGYVCLLSTQQQLNANCLKQIWVQISDNWMTLTKIWQKQTGNTRMYGKIKEEKTEDKKSQWRSLTRERTPMIRHCKCQKLETKSRFGIEKELSFIYQLCQQ